MAISTQASGIVYNMEQAKRKLHATQQAIIRNTSDRVKAAQTIVNCDTEDARLKASEQSLKLELQGYFQNYIRAGQSWMKIEAVDPEPKTEEPVK